ncbi:MAG: hypothetical protein GXO85_10465 [Chlorobi bacterium]|nr:hypothetical protein [Chlorobiota bacterium]
MNKYFKLFIIILVIILSACSDQNKICGSDNPLDEIAWLREIRDQFDEDMGPQRQRIIQYKYYGNDVFLIEECFQCADAVSIVYDCEKNIVCEFGGYSGKNTCPDFNQNATEEKILYDN